MKYRPEIDGLRSFAVIPVVLYHAGMTNFSGGFTGVDVFFVISGYLISNIIISEMKAGSFSYSGFYERRVRRIMPALVLVVLFGVVSSLIFALPNQVEQIANSSIFAILGVANIYFWTQSGYFAPASEYQMLLHTWSLGVEEQFYLFLPVVLVFIFRFKINLRVAILTALPLLFLAGLWLSFSKPSVAFYLLPARAWELALGVALAAGVVPHLKSARGNSVIAFLGLGAVVASIFLIDNQMPFPGWAALLPCLGATAVIYAASPDNLVGRFLSLAPLRFIGSISYSLYLWHWPIFVTLRLYSAEAHLDTSLALFGTTLSVFLAFLTWRFIETPFRKREVVSLRATLVSVGVVSVFAFVISIYAIVNSGVPNRLNASAQQFAAAAEDIDPLRMQCQGIRDINDESCWFGTADTKPSFILVGDSHAGAIRPAIEEWASSTGRTGTILWRGGCPMVIAARIIPDSDTAKCSEFKDRAVEAILANKDLELVILAGRWEAAYSGVAPEIGGSYRTFWVDDIEAETTPKVSNRVFQRGLARTAEIFIEAGREVVFLGAVPEVGFDVPTLLALAAHNQGTTTSMKLNRDNAVAVGLDKLFEEISENIDGVRYLSVWEDFCSDRCNLLLDGVPLYSDDDHLTLTAARQFMGPILVEELTSVVNSLK